MSQKVLQACKKANVKLQDLVVPICAAAWMIYQIIASYGLKKNGYDVLGAGGWPRIVCFLGLFCILLYILQCVVKVVKAMNGEAVVSAGEADEAAEEDQDKAHEKKSKGIIGWCRKHYAISMLVMCCIYVALVDYIGFMIASAIFLPTTMFMFTRDLTKGKIIVIIAMTVLFSVGLYYVFYNAFSIILPGGRLF